LISLDYDFNIKWNKRTERKIFTIGFQEKRGTLGIGSERYFLNQDEGKKLLQYISGHLGAGKIMFRKILCPF